MNPDELHARVHRLFRRGLSLRLCSELLDANAPRLLADVEHLTDQQLQGMNQ